ncbi:MAG: hypothetical protein LBE91_02520 [Tannerella sp.]|jgi:hypothetical protein|nr:hypothetical protein [Tannerella sp.]
MIGEYTFVTLDNDMLTTGDAVFVDIDEQMNTEMDFVQIDDSFDFADMDNGSDFIVMDDVDMIHDSDIDSYLSDINESDVTIIL